MSWFSSKSSHSSGGRDDDSGWSAEEVAGTIVRKLVGAEGPQSVTDLQATTDVPFGSFAQGLSRATETGYVELIGNPGQEKVALTPRGEEAAHRQ